MAEALIAKGDFPRAAEAIAKLKTDFPKAPSVYILEGKLMGFEAQDAEAARAFSYALTLEPRALDAVVGLVGVDLETGNTASAVKRAESLLQAKPGDPAMRLLASRAYFANKQPQKTEELLKGLLQDNGSNTMALSLLADLYMKQGRAAEALERFQALAVLEPSRYRPTR